MTIQYHHANVEDQLTNMDTITMVGYVHYAG